MTKETPYKANSLVRGLRILEAFDHANPSLTLSQISDALSVTSSAAYRFVQTLEAEGYLSRDPKTKSYRLAPRVMDLGFRYIKSLDIGEVAQPFIRELRDITSFSSHVAILDGTDIVYTFRALSNRPMISNIPIGSRLPAFATSMGRLMLCALAQDALEARFQDYRFEAFTEHTPRSLKALMALLKEDRPRGYIAQNSHLATGVYAIAAPLVDKKGITVGAINISGHELQLKGEPGMITKVRDTARNISSML